MSGLSEIISNVWEQGLLGIGITEIIVSLLIFIAGAIARALFVGRVMKRLEKLTSNTQSEIDDVLLESLRRPLGYIPITIAIYLIAVYLPLSGIAEIFATNLIKAMIAFTIFTALANSVPPIFQALTSSTVLTESMTKWLERAARVIIWIVGIGIIFDIFGIQIGPLVAGLGLFSVAVALGAQDFFKNLISGILIIGEGKFQPGDRIEAGTIHGIVETIGFRSTVVRNFDSAPMLIPNKDLSDVKVTNHGEMENRRINWKINLIYSSSVEQLESIRNEIKQFIITDKDFLSEDSYEPVVRVVELGASSIDILIVAYAPRMGFASFNALKEKLIFKIMKIVKDNGSEFAYPSTSLYVESMPE